MIKRVLLIIAWIFLAFSLIGCETFKGMGRDVQSAGEVVEGTAKKVDDKI